MGEQPHWLIIVQQDDPEGCAALRNAYARSPWVQVLTERRQRERRWQALTPAEEGRLTERRGASGYRLARRGRGYDVVEAESVVPAHCPECGLLISFEMPRFAEPPIQLGVDIVHETVQPRRPRHSVDLRAVTTTGRAPVALRLMAVTRIEARG